jgi:hypothetical protein
MPKQTKQLVKPYKKQTTPETELGKSIIENPDSAYVSYRGKKWKLGELVELLAQYAHVLEHNQCCPSGECLFRYYDYVDDVVANVLEKEMEEYE